MCVCMSNNVYMTIFQTIYYNPKCDPFPQKTIEGHALTPNNEASEHILREALEAYVKRHLRWWHSSVMMSIGYVTGYILLPNEAETWWLPVMAVVMTTVLLISSDVRGNLYLLAGKHYVCVVKWVCSMCNLVLVCWPSNVSCMCVKRLDWQLTFNTLLCQAGCMLLNILWRL